MEIFNMFAGAMEEHASEETPEGFRCNAVSIGKRIGATRMGMTVYELPPGQAVCPYHFEWTDEEWLFVIAGSPTLRSPEGERTLEAGDVVCFPAGPDGAHLVRANDDTARIAIISTKNAVGVAEYPDSDKVGVWANGTHYMLRRSEHLDYWDGER
ncbi:MAG TPA: cupin domain-containing protein [Gaiellaceae bacterium]|nr:cupin domain-containing protein [Gaiellaceae bacterium]